MDDFTLVLDITSGSSVDLSSISSLHSSDFIRLGSDLVIKTLDGETVLIRGYFAVENPPALVAANGAVVSPDLVQKLAGPLAPGQYAQAAGSTVLGDAIGRVETLDGVVRVTRSDGKEVQLVDGDAIFQGDVIVTLDASSVGIIFADDSSLSLGEDGRMIMDEMVYDPAGETGSSVISLTQGAFTFISGAIAKTQPDAVSINTPLATIGIRGTALGGRVGRDGSFEAALLPEAGQVSGEVTVTALDGSSFTINQSGQGVAITSTGDVTTRSYSAKEVGQLVGKALAAQPNADHLDAGFKEAAEKGVEAAKETPSLEEVELELNAAIEAGEEQAHLFDQTLLQAETFLRPPLVVEPDVKLILQEDRILQQKINTLQTDYSADAQTILAIVNQAATAATNAGNAEDSAAASASSIAAQLSVQGTDSSVGLSTTEVQSLAEIVTGPLKSLGAAGAISATSSSVSKAALALLSLVGTTTPPDADVIAELQAAAQAAEDAAAKVVLIVNAAIAATEKVFASAITAAKNAGSNKAAAAEAIAATNFETEVASALSTDSSNTANISFDALPDLVNTVTTKVSSAASTLSAKGNVPATLSDVIGFAVKTAAAADLAAEEAFQTIRLTDPTQIRAAATKALNHAKTAESERANAANSVDETALSKQLDSSILDEFLAAVERVNTAEAEAKEAVSAIEGATDALAAAADYIDGTALADLNTAKAVVISLQTSSATAKEAVLTAQGVVKTARTTLADKLITEAVAKAKYAALKTAADEASARLDQSLESVLVNQNLGALSGTDSVSVALQKAAQTESTAKTTADTARAAADADPTDAVLEAQAKLAEQLHANADTTKAFAQKLFKLFDDAATDAQTKATTAQAAVTQATADVATAKTDLTAKEDTLDAKLAASLAELDKLSTAKTEVATLEGKYLVAQAAAEGQAKAALDIALAKVVAALVAVEASSLITGSNADVAEVAARDANFVQTKIALNKVEVAFAAIETAKAGATDALTQAKDAVKLSYARQGVEAEAARDAQLVQAQASYDRLVKLHETARLDLETAKRAYVVAEAPIIEAANQASLQQLLSDAAAKEKEALRLEKVLDEKKAELVAAQADLVDATEKRDQAQAQYDNWVALNSSGFFDDEVAAAKVRLDAVKVKYDEAFALDATKIAEVATAQSNYDAARLVADDTAANAAAVQAVNDAAKGDADIEGAKVAIDQADAAATQAASLAAAQKAEIAAAQTITEAAAKEAATALVVATAAAKEQAELAQTHLTSAQVHQAEVVAYGVVATAALTTVQTLETQALSNGSSINLADIALLKTKALEALNGAKTSLLKVEIAALGADAASDMAFDLASGKGADALTQAKVAQTSAASAGGVKEEADKSFQQIDVAYGRILSIADLAQAQADATTQANAAASEVTTQADQASQATDEASSQAATAQNAEELAAITRAKAFADISIAKADLAAAAAQNSDSASAEVARRSADQAKAAAQAAAEIAAGKGDLAAAQVARANTAVIDAETAAQSVDSNRVIAQNAIDDYAYTATDIASVTTRVLDNDEGSNLSITSVDATGSDGTVSISSDRKSVTYTPDAATFEALKEGVVETRTFTYTLSDNSTASVHVTITGTNAAPTLVADSKTQIDEITALNIDVLANDSDVENDTLSITDVSDGTYGTVKIESDGTLTYTPNAGAYDFLSVGETKSDSFIYEVSDGGILGTSLAEVTVTYTGSNDTPVASADTATAADHSTAVTLNVLSNDTDVDANDTLSVKSVANGSNGTAVLNQDGTITYTPTSSAFKHLNVGETATDSFTYILQDDQGGESTGTVTVTITGTNDAPELTADTGTVAENGSTTLSVLTNDSDADTGDVLSLLSVSQGGKGSVVIADNGTDVIYKPTSTALEALGVGETTTDTFTYTVSDSYGAAATETVTLTITGTNDAPIVKQEIADTQATEGKAFSYTISADSFSDIDTNDTLTYSTSSLPSWLSFNAQTRIFTGTPATSDIGTQNITVTVTDGSGATAEDTFTLTTIEDPSVTLTGTSANDILIGKEGDDDITADSGDDVLFGNAGDDHLKGGAGNDNLNGGLGDDIINGGDGIDQVSYIDLGATGGVTVDLTKQGTAQSVGGNMGVDTLISIENLQGSDFGDTLIGDDNNNWLYGMAGNDTITTGNGIDFAYGHQGNDKLIGGDHADNLYGGDDHDTVFGGKGDDNLHGDAGNDTVLGGDGRDFIYGGAGDDHLLGEEGNDRLHASLGGVDTYDGGDGFDELAYHIAGTSMGISVDLSKAGVAQFISAEMGSDVITGIEYIHATSFNDILIGDDNGNMFGANGGDDVIHTGNGNNYAWAGDGNDTITGGNGNDNLSGDNGNDTITGGLGNDALGGGAGDDTIFGGDGRDFLTGGAGDDILKAEEGNDRIHASLGGSDTYDGGDGFDELVYHLSGATTGISVDLSKAGVAQTISDEMGSDVITGIEYIIATDFDDVLIGDDTGNNFGTRAGDDVIYTGNGNNYVWAHAGNDTITGGNGNDNLNGGDGNDTITGGTGNDALNGEAGNDTIFGGDGRDFLTGGAGDDILKAEEGNDRIHASLGGSDTYDGGAGFDELVYHLSGATMGVSIDLSKAGVAQTISAEMGSDVIAGIEYIIATDFDDVLIGDDTDNNFGTREGDDVIYTGNGNNYVWAHAGNDRITGGNGNDDLNGGNGDDTVIGGAGSDNLRGDAGNDTIFGGDGRDFLTGGADDDILKGEEGDDRLHASLGGTDTYDGGDGFDELAYHISGASMGISVDLSKAGVAQLISAEMGSDIITSIEYIHATDFNDILIGDDNGNMFGAGGGDDVIHTGNGDNHAWAYDGNDTITGGIGYDYLYGGNGNDYIDGGAGGGQIHGEAGDDTLIGGSDADTIYDGADNDTVIANGGNDVIISGLGGSDTYHGGDGFDILRYIWTANVTQGVTVDLRIQDQAQLVSDEMGSDLITGIEYIQSTNFDDHLIGDDTGNLFGTNAGDDVIHTGNGNNIVWAHAGNDTIIAGNGNDSLTGGDGDDVINGGAGSDLIIGNAGSDALYGQDGDDDIYAGLGGNDTYDGGAGHDKLIYHDAVTMGMTIDLTKLGTAQLISSELGSDTLISIENVHSHNYDDILIGNDQDNAFSAYGGNDVINTGNGNNHAYGYEGNDIITCGDGNDLVWGMEDNDTITGGGGADQLYGHAGNDVIYGGDGTDSLYGGSGDDVLFTEHGNNFAWGEEGNDTITGGDGVDNLAGGAGDDTVIGGAGNDGLGGDEGNDILLGGDGNDTIYDGAGDDVLKGEEGNDRLYVHGSLGGADTYDGGAGFDIIDYHISGATMGISVDLSKAGVAQTISAEMGSDVIIGFEYIISTNFNDTLTGDDTGNIFGAQGGDDIIYTGNGNNIVWAHAGNDTIIAGTGNDSLSGGDGDDVLNGGTGNDTLDGGAGNDTLIYDAEDITRVNGGADNDILSFQSSGDSLDLSTIADTVYTNLEAIDLTGSGDNSLTFDISDILAINEGANGFMAATNYAATDNLLIIDGDAGDTLTMNGSWSDTTTDVSLVLDGSTSESYSVYQSNDGTATVVLNDQVSLV
ncbi:Ig-like domain-containing protein [Candidatus Terasakiella magnetica]|uniref:Ig-like domain-containing protein n=1 Tax=Candidatus Terasakiella magnetica TaxID=1867952 RepID=UPI000F83A16D|nr:Ig-like domain-containing protein [Candidatus Terasakiella magnetica]